MIIMIIMGGVEGKMVGKGIRIIEEESNMDIYMKDMRD